LDGVAQHQQQDQVEGGQVAHLALAGEAQNDRKEYVDDRAADDELVPGEREVPHRAFHRTLLRGVAASVPRPPAPGLRGVPAGSRHRVLNSRLQWGKAQRETPCPPQPRPLPRPPTPSSPRASKASSPVKPPSARSSRAVFSIAASR